MTDDGAVSLEWSSNRSTTGRDEVLEETGDGQYDGKSLAEHGISHPDV